MTCAGWLRATVLLVASLAPLGCPAQELSLTVGSEHGFRRLIEMAQTGRLGPDVANANVAVDHGIAHIELVAADGATRRLVLTPARSEETAFFTVTAGAGATAADVERVSRALDTIFEHSPYQLAGLEEEVGAWRPSLVDGYRSDGWRGALQAAERNMMRLVTRGYTIGVIVALALGLCSSVLVLVASHRSV